MTMAARIKSNVGGRLNSKILDMNGTTTVYVPSDSNLIYFNALGASTVTRLYCPPAERNRLVWFVNANNTGIVAVTLTNTNGASTEGTMDLGGSNVGLGPTDVIALFCRDDGTWIRATPVANN